jgi:hypothetical protein
MACSRTPAKRPGSSKPDGEAKRLISVSSAPSSPKPRRWRVRAPICGTRS